MEPEDTFLEEAMTEAKTKEADIVKLCRTCGETKSILEFYTRRDRKQGDAYGRVSKCKACSIAAYRRWYTGLPTEKKTEVLRKGRKASYLSRHKGRVTEEEADKLSRSKMGNCEICSRATEVFIDHCHRTGARRGFLCERCNFVLGLVSDDTSVLIAGVDYLTKFMEKRLWELRNGRVNKG